MSLSNDVDLEEFVMAKDDLSGADIKAVCTEAGLLALRERRMRVTKTDFTTAREKVSSSRTFVASVSMPFVGVIQKERGYSGGALLVNAWSCLSWGQSFPYANILCLGYPRTLNYVRNGTANHTNLFGYLRPAGTDPV